LINRISIFSRCFKINEVLLTCGLADVIFDDFLEMNVDLMSEGPFFSVIIPTFNRGHVIQKTIETVLAQDFKEFEVVIVDDGSTDNTGVVVKAIESDKIRYYKKENAERSAARNFGARTAKGRYVNFLDSDDLLYPNHLREAFGFCMKNAEVEIFHLGFDMKDGGGRVLQGVDNVTSINKQIIDGNLLSCNGVFVRRDVILKHQFNEDRLLSSLEDWELWIRMSARYKFRHVNVVTSTVIQHEGRSVMAQDVSKIKEKVNRFVKYILMDEVIKNVYGPAINRAVASAWTYAALHLAISRDRKDEILTYLLKGVRAHPGEFFKRRFLVVISKLVGL
jgi:glycosyltransferase involved in cell wall biosynthesis